MSQLRPMLAAGLLIAWQVAAKAARDGLFLSSFPATLLPQMVAGASVVAMATVPLAAFLFTRVGPSRVVPAALFVTSGAMFGVLGLQRTSPSWAAVALYLLVAASGAMLISGFWSVMNERFDPRTGKVWFARIGWAATGGGMLGGLAAERITALASVEVLLGVLGATHLVCGVAMIGLGGTPQPDDDEDVPLVPRPYLRWLFALVLVLTVASGLLDYAFKAAAADAFATDDAGLLRFFALFYTGLGALTFGIQLLASTAVIGELGVARAVALLPVVLAGGGLAAAAAGAFPLLVGLRGGAESLRNSVHRVAYELLFVPLGPAEKRRVKTFVDVGASKAGDIVGAGVVGVILAAPLATEPLLLLGVAGLGIVAVAITVNLGRGYVGELERSLEAGDVAVQTIADGLTRDLLLKTLVDLPRAEPAAPARPTHQDPVSERVAALRSRDAEVVRAALSGPLPPELAGHVVPLLAWDDVAGPAAAALVRVGRTGVLVDALLDDDEVFAVRRRIPAVLASDPSQRAREGLLAALEDRRFEVRFQAARALQRQHERAPFEVGRRRIYTIILAETRVSPEVWRTRTLLGDDRPGRSLEHVFTLLSLVGSTDAARGALSDPSLRGTALEYLETTLPAEVWKALQPHVDDAR